LAVEECSILLTQVDIQNYRSIYQSSVVLSPFTLLIGANGAGKSNFLQLLKDISAHSHTASAASAPSARVALPTHHSFVLEDQLVAVHSDRQQSYSIHKRGDTLSYFLREKDELVTSLVLELEQSCFDEIDDVRPPLGLAELEDVKIFSLEPHRAGLAESLIPQPTIKENGAGLVQVLDSLKTGDREDLFNHIESIFKSYIPEVEKLSLVSDHNSKSLQVREVCSLAPTPLSQLSKGAQIALTLIAILNQERRPSLVCIEDIDYGLHPRLCKRLVRLCQNLSQQKDGVQIIATTHNPALVNELKGDESAIVLVEKENGQTKFSTLDQRLKSQKLSSELSANIEQASSQPAQHFIRATHIPVGAKR
jgi:ABC-type branched-subunit amino acid transport system ATPase component